MVFAALAEVGRHTDQGAAVVAAALIRLALEVVRTLLLAAASLGVPQLRRRTPAHFVRCEKTHDESQPARLPRNVSFIKTG